MKIFQNDTQTHQKSRGEIWAEVNFFTKTQLTLFLIRFEWEGPAIIVIFIITVIITVVMTLVRLYKIQNIYYISFVVEW